MIKTFYLSIALFFLSLQLWAQARTFDAIFPGLSPETKTSVFTETGYLKSVKAASVNSLIGSRPNGLNPDIAGNVLKNGAGYYVEALVVIPVKKNLLEVYNVLGEIRGLKGRLYPSSSKGQNIPLFEEATRIESDKKNNPIPDPPPADFLPKTDTVFIRLKDSNFGSSYYRGNMLLLNNGLKYTLTNYKSLTYMLIPVIKEEKFVTQLYFEIINEGVLIYSITSADASDFVASKIDMPSAIRKRLAVIISWVSDGLKK